MSSKTTTHFSARKRLLAAAVSACFVSTSAWSNPTAPQVVNGAASFNQAGSLLTVTNSNGAIINWNTFSIAAGETTRFNQASAASSVLNRVLANDPSVLLGTLSSNGRVWLVNPAGIMVGQGARIDVAGFVGSTLNVRNEDFLANRLNFQATPNAGSIQNYGQITTPSGGSVYLVAPTVENHGIINAPNGEVILAAGQTVQLLDTGTPGVKVEITGTEGNATNLGEIVSEAGRIGLAGVLVRNSGTLNASSLVKEGGRVFLKASQDAYVDGAGRIVTTGTKGGSIEVLGNRVAVMDQAQLDASGDTGGGTVLVGGDYQGKNPDVQNANITYFGPQASIKADATQNGDGGKVIVWADDTTRAYGNISAQGGPGGGNGGFVETSGHNWLDVFGARVNTSSSLGTTGSWLLDPTDVSIIAYGGTPTFEPYTTTFGGTNSSGVFGGASSGPATLYWETISSALTSTNVTVTTTGTQSGGTGNITVSTSPGLANVVISHPLPAGGSWGNTWYGGGYNSSNSLTLLANNAVNINAPFGNAGTGAITILAGWDGVSTATPALNAGFSTSQNINFNSGGFIVSNGNVTLKAVNAINIQPTVYGAGIEMNAGALYVEATKLNLTAGTSIGSPAGIDSNGGQVFDLNKRNLAGGLQLLGSNTATVYGSWAGIRQYGTSAGQGQTFNIYYGGTVDMYGGAGNGVMPANYWTTGDCSYGGCSGDWVNVANYGPGGQTFNFVSGGALNLYGGSAGDNFVSVENGLGIQTITGNPNILVKGGSAGGVTVNGQLLSTDAGIWSDSIQVINANTITVDGNSATTANGAGAGIGATLGQTIVATGQITITGGGGGSGNHAAILSMGGVQDITAGAMLLKAGTGGGDNSASIQSPTQIIHASSVEIDGGGATGSSSGARIGGFEINTPGPTNLQLFTTGDILLTGGSTSGAAIGANALGGVTTDITINSGGNVTLTPGSGNGARIGSPTANIAGGNIAITAGGALTLNSTSPSTATGILTLGNVSVTAAAITEGINSAIVAGGLTTIKATSGGISLPGVNDFTGAVSLSDSGANNVAVRDVNAIVLGKSNVGNGTLTITAGGTITQTGPIVQAAGAGLASFLTTAVGGSAVTLQDAGNDFTGPVRLDSGIQPTIVTDANSIVLQGGAGGGGGGGNITINANGMVSQSTAFTGSVGNVVVNAGAGPIVFTDPGNNFTATGLSANTSGAASLVNAAAVNLAASNIGGTLTVTAPQITQSGPIAASALVTKSVTGTTLNDTGNKIASFTATNSNSGNVELTNTGVLSIGGISNSGGDIWIDNTGEVTTTGAISAPTGVVSIVANSPLTIGAGGVSAGGDIFLSAEGTPALTDNLTLNGAIQTSTGSIYLYADDNLFQNANVTGGPVYAVAQNGSIVMAAGATTSTGGGSIIYTPVLGSATLSSLNAGSGGDIMVVAGTDITTAAGFSGANLTGNSATIVAGGNLNLTTAVSLLNVTVQGTYSIFDQLTGTLMTNVPAAGVAAVTNQVVTTVVATTQPPPTTDQTPVPPPTVPGDPASTLLIDSTQTIGGTTDAFGGSSGDTGSSDTGSSGQGGKPAAKKLATCS